MKKRLAVYAFTLGVSLLSAAVISAQPGSGIRYNELASSSPKKEPANLSADKRALNQIRIYSEKMFKHFTKNFPDASHLKVRNEKEGLYVTLNINDSVVRVMYNKKGRQLYSILSYASSELPESVVERVEFTFPGYTIYGVVIEVTVNYKTAQLILIENKRTWRRVRLVNDEIDIYEEHTKSL